VPSLTDINNYFATQKNQFDSNILTHIWRTNPFISLFPRKEFDASQGRIPEVITSTHELPTAYPFGLANLILSSGTGSPACDVEPAVIKSGHKKRSYQLEVASFETEVICLTDLQFQYQAVQQVTNKEDGLREYTRVWMSDWFRVHNIGMHDHKASTTSVANVTIKTDALYDFSTLTLPTFELNWIHLTGLYDYFTGRGAGDPMFAIGMAMGSHTFGITSGPGYKRKLFQDDELVRETVNYSSDSTLNFAARGINQAVNGFVPNVDEFPIRFAADGTTAIYPTINQDTSVGRESVPNPNYRTVANGGLAVYEVVTITMKNTYEVRPRSVGPLGFGMEKFDATRYTADFQWINNKDMASNKLGNKGFYRADVQQAAKPMYPQFGMSILTLAID
jgi:hypothetical protein